MDGLPGSAPGSCGGRDRPGIFRRSAGLGPALKGTDPMRMTRLAFLPLLAAACLAGPAAVRAEEPEKGASKEGGSKEGAGRWTLHLEHGPLNTARWTDGSGKTVAYHYMTLKATNKTAFA